MVQIKINYADMRNYGGKRSTKNIEYIVMHYTGNDGDSDEANARYFQKNIVLASAHYFVDDDSITQSVPDDRVAWAVGGKKYPSTNGGSLNGICTNDNSISVELCDVKKNGKYDFTEKTLSNAVELVRLLMKKYGVPVENVIRHYDVTGKQCPQPFVKHKTNWQKFKERLEEEMVENSKIIINGKEIPVKRILKDGTNYIAIRDVADAIGYNVTSKGSVAVLNKK